MKIGLIDVFSGNIKKGNRQMKLLLILLVSLVTACSETPKETVKDTTDKVPDNAKVYEVGCGLCVYDAETAEECESYVSIDGKTIPITGKVLDAHGVGLCEYKGTAYLSGEVKDGKFEATFMKIKEFDKSKNYQE